jgi:hypothetical protein
MATEIFIAVIRFETWYTYPQYGQKAIAVMWPFNPLTDDD